MKKSLIFALLSLSSFLRADELPPEAQHLKLVKEAEIERIEARYQAALIALRDKFTKEGALKKATAVDAFILEKLDSIISSVKKLKAGKLEKVTLKWDPRGLSKSGILVLHKNGKATHSGWKSTHSWTLQKDNTIKVWIKKSVHLISPLTEQSTSAPVKSSKDQAARVSIIK